MSAPEEHKKRSGATSPSKGIKKKKTKSTNTTGESPKKKKKIPKKKTSSTSKVVVDRPPKKKTSTTSTVTVEQPPKKKTSTTVTSDKPKKKKTKEIKNKKKTKKSTSTVVRKKKSTKSNPSGPDSGATTSPPPVVASNLERSIVNEKKAKNIQDWNAGPPEIEPDEIEYFEKIGGGCFGDVYRGRCRGIEVAVKKLSKQDMDEKTLQDFKKEVEIMSKLNHPNVVLFMGACTTPGYMAIVTEILKKGNFSQMLHNPKVKLPLQRRMQMTRDAALGMNWLHESRPVIVHRDIKPSNFLIDNNLNVKVCDFGLSVVKPRGEVLRDKDSIPGTPLWMAPEVLQGKDVDEKSDVYSFGLVLWEIVTQQEIFPHHNDYGVFKRSICGSPPERPVIPKNTLPSLKLLIESCWVPNPSKRPSFKQIISMLDTVIVDCNINDTAGRNFWKESFLGREEVSWKEFLRRFKVKIVASSNKGLTNDEIEVCVKCLKAMVAEKSRDITLCGMVEDDRLVVSLEKFGKMCDLFGPASEMLPKTKAVLKNDWFHGEISREEAENKLDVQDPGVFLVRLSNTESGCFTISKKTKRGNIHHQRVQYLGSDGFAITTGAKNQTEKKINEANLDRFIEKMKDELFLEKACPGSMYKSLFNKGPVLDGYLLNDSDEDDV